MVALTDSTGAVVNTYDYDAFGNVVKQTGTVVNPYLYAGYRFDTETGLYYLQSSYYNSKVGRFFTKDSFEGFEKDPLSLNQYIYGSNNPVMNVDPTGHISWRFFYYLHRGVREILDGISDMIWGLWRFHRGLAWILRGLFFSARAAAWTGQYQAATVFAAIAISYGYYFWRIRSVCLGIIGIRDGIRSIRRAFRYW